MEDTKILCRICLKSNVFCKVVDSTCHVNFFIQITGLEISNEKLFLCIWCNAALKRTIDLIKLARESQSFLTLHYEPSRNDSVEPHKYLYDLCTLQNSPVDIPAMSESDKVTDNVPELGESSYSLTVTDIKIECEFDEYAQESMLESNNDKLLDAQESTLESNNDKSLDAEHQLKNSDLIKKEDLKLEEKKLNVNLKKETKKKPDSNYDEFKFGVKYLNLEEQLKELEAKKQKNSNMKFLCGMCGTGFLTEDLFEEHGERHCELAGPHFCPVCYLHFRNKATMSQHSLLHSRVFHCQLCNTEFNKWDRCLAHRQQCGNAPSPTSCQHCSKIFNNKYSLDVHIKRVHANVKKYSCSECKNEFVNKQRLVEHMRSHTGQRPFSCVECKRTFATNSNLIAHASVHSDVSAFYCVECNISYKTAKSLKRHFAQSSRHVQRARHPRQCNKRVKCEPQDDTPPSTME